MFKKMTVTYEDGSTVDVHGKRSDVVKFERRFGVPASSIFLEGIWTERLWFFAWCAAGRDKPDTPDFDQWIETVESVEVVTDEVDEAPPTEPDSPPTP